MAANSRNEQSAGRNSRRTGEWVDMALTGLALTALGALAAFRVYQYWAYEVDDALITVRAAHNFAAGYGFVYNRGGPRVESHSSHLVWMLQVAVAWLTGGYALWMTRLAGVSGFAVSVLCAAGMARDLVRWSVSAGGRCGQANHEDAARTDAAALPLSRLTFWAGASTLVSTNILATGAVSGLETALFAGLVAAACWGFLRLAAGEGGWATMAAAGVAAGLATWTRPEGIAWAVGLGLFASLVAAFGAGSLANAPARRPLFALLTATVFWGVLTVFRLVVYGRFHPNPYYAKLGGPALDRVAGGAAYLNDFVVHHLGWVLLGGAVAGVLLTRGRAARGAAAMLLAGAAGHLGVTVWEGGDWIPHLRFVAPVLAPLAALLSVALGLGLLRLAPRHTVAVSAAASLIFAALFLGAAQRPNRRATDEIQTRVYGWYDAHVPLGKWLGEWNAHRLRNGPAPLTVALEDIGFVGLLSNAQIIDLAGLADPDWARLIYDSRGKARYPTKRLVLGQRPEVIVLTAGALLPHGGPRWMNPTVDTIANDPDFRQHYRQRAVYTHKHFPGDGYYLHVFLRADIYDEPPRAPDPPRPRAWAGWDLPPPR